MVSLLTVSFVQRVFFPTRFADLGLAKDQSEQNPVFYIQYAHARSVSIINKSKNEDLYSIEKFNYNLLTKSEEIDLIRCLLKFPDLITKSIDDLEPQLIANYLMEVASKFHHYYAKHKVVTDNNDLSISRTILVDAIRQVLYNGLNILGLTAPNKM